MGFSLKKKLQQRSVKRTSRVAIALSGALLILFAVRPAHAENLVITQPTDFWFHYDDTTTFNARTYDVPNHPSDPQLWLYNSEGTLIFTNDDWYGLQSRIQIQVEPGWYRLRAGTCCYEPDVWRIWDTTWNIDYELSVVGMTDSPTTTTEAATTTSSIVEWQTTTSTLTPTSVPESTSLPSTSSPTSSTTTTTLPTPTTTTSTTLAPTTTEQSTTTTVTPSSLLTTTSSLMLPTSSLPSTSTTTTTVSPPVRTTTTLVSTTTTGTPTTTTVVTAPTSTATSVATSTTTTIPTTADTPEEAVAILQSFSDPVAVDAAITQIAENLDTLTTEQLDEIALVVSKAPPEVKKKFESEINIFGGGLDNYTPVGSTVNVGERRTLVVIGAVLTAMPVIAPKRK